MTDQELNTRLTSLFDAHKHTEHLISRLAKLPVQIGSAPSSLEIDARELAREIHQSLKEQEVDLELLRQEADDQANSGLTAAAWSKNSERERKRTDLEARVIRLGENLSTARSQFRKAQLQAKRNAEAAKRKERELLFTNLEEDSGPASYTRRKGHENTSKGDQVLNASTDVTAALKQTLTLMSQEVSKSQFARETLEESTAVLQNITETYSNIDTLLSSSRTLVSSLLHSQKSDTWYLESAFWLLVATICWLVFRRILYGPGWWLLYLPIGLIWRLMIFNTRAILGLFVTTAGTLGGAKRSSTLPQTSERISTSLIIQPSATGDFPRFKLDMPKPSMVVGAGGSGAKTQQAVHKSHTTGESLLEKVDNMVGQGQQEPQISDTVLGHAEQVTVLRERSHDEPPNPKKRMWEEPPAEVSEEARQRDEL